MTSTLRTTAPSKQWSASVGSQTGWMTEWLTTIVRVPWARLSLTAQT